MNPMKCKRAEKSQQLICTFLNDFLTFAYFRDLAVSLTETSMPRKLKKMLGDFFRETVERKKTGIIG